MSLRLRLLVLLLGLLTPVTVLADEPADVEVNTLRASYEYGRYAEVLERAGTRIDRGSLSDKDLAELHKLAGLSAFHLKRMDDAARHFRALLRLEPDFNLDPFATPPPVVTYLDDIRQQMSAELELVRQERRLRMERERTAAERRERERLAAEEQRRRVETLSRQITVREVESRSFLVNFVPFGAGQFQQGRTGLGTLFAASEGALAVTSIISFFAYSSLVKTRKVTVDDIDGGTLDVPVRYIPTSDRLQADNWTRLKWGSAAGFYAVYAVGVLDALLHHQDQVVQTHIETLPAPPALKESTPDPAPPRASLHLFPTSGGAGAGFSLAF
ncbi:tetratricopeptide repeat protein [Archangium violaceum]|uniref:tetratricopeptide repeat protein n=1 Tax=Archangium violaceum TaxID=83451 RepID=UPI002B301304|nr:tetratricopeptide repeat protein [Archangium violaceum]